MPSAAICTVINRSCSYQKEDEIISGVFAARCFQYHLHHLQLPSAVLAFAIFSVSASDSLITGVEVSQISPADEMSCLILEPAHLTLSLFIQTLGQTNWDAVTDIRF